MLSNEENIDDENVDENVENILRMYILMIKFFTVQNVELLQHKNMEYGSIETENMRKLKSSSRTQLRILRRSSRTPLITDAETEELRKLKSYSKTEWRILRRSSRLL